MSLLIVDKGNNNGATPLFVAAQNGNEPIANIQLAAGASVHQPNTVNGATPFYVAAGYGHEPVVKILLAAGASVDQPNTFNGAAPLCIAAECGKEPMRRIKATKLSRKSCSPPEPTRPRRPLWARRPRWPRRKGTSRWRSCCADVFREYSCRVVCCVWG